MCVCVCVVGQSGYNFYVLILHVFIFFFVFDRTVTNFILHYLQLATHVKTKINSFRTQSSIDNLFASEFSHESNDAVIAITESEIANQLF